ncbi:MAG: hypothetical protein KF802_09295 [Bdellovibrionaceae bacterium]|nr:hypothetical protein [Pseudobdellovibrionaceae bacterium]MBX3033689.1 hypothetical protein [Pseudobdellovibrionaceae bacterium]
MTGWLLTLFLSGSLVAAPRTAEGPADLIEKAHNLSLQKDRVQAVNILVAAIKREPPNSSGAKELKNALQEISSAFLSDKAQQLYELAVSFRKTDLNQMQSRLSEALRLEPDNLLLLNEQARLQIAKNECGAASEVMAKHRKWNPYDEQTLLTSAQAEVCLSDWPAYTTLRSQAEGRKGPHAQFWLALEVERGLKEKAETRARESLELLRKESPQYPEIPFWSLKLSKDAHTKASLAQKYVMDCKNISAAQLRRYMMEPLLCRRMAEAESFIKGP